MIGTISRSFVENIAFTDNMTFGEQVEETVFGLVSLALEDMEKNVPYIKVANCIMQPTDENFSKTYIPGGDFVYYLGIANPQLEINTLTYSNFWKNFKHRLSEAWIDSSRRLRKKREKRLKAGVEDEKKLNTNYEKYTIENFTADFQYALSKFLMQTTVIYKSKNCIKLIGKDDFGVNTTIVIYPVLLEGNNYKRFISRRKGYSVINYEYRAKLLNERVEQVGTNYIFMSKILNYLMRELTKQPANPLLIEGILYNCPIRFLKGEDIYNCFVKLINYLRFTDISSYQSVLTQGKKIFEDKEMSNGAAAYQYSKFLKAFDKINLDIVKA